MDYRIKRCVCMGLSCLVLLTAVSCAPAPQETNGHCDLDLSLVSDAIALSVTPEGGIKNPGSVLSVDLWLLQDTYYACLTASVTGYLDDLPAEKIKSRLSTVTMEDVLSNGDDVISNVFHFLETCRLIGYQPDAALKNELLDYMEELYCEEGYFYPSKPGEYGNVQVDLTSIEAQQAVLCAAAAIPDRLDAEAQRAILEKFSSLVEDVDLRQYAEPATSVVVTYCELARRLPSPLPEKIDEAARAYCEAYVLRILSEEENDVDIGTFNKLVKSMRVNTLDSGMRQKIEEKVYEYYCGGSFGIFPGEDGGVLTSTWYAVDLLASLGCTIPASVCGEVNQYLVENMLYTGMMASIHIAPDITETVFAWKILVEYADDPEVRATLETYLDEAYRTIRRRYRDLSTLYLIEYADEVGLPDDLTISMWDSFLSTKLMASDYSDIGLDTLYYIVRLMDKTGYALPADQRELLLENLEETLDQIPRLVEAGRMSPGEKIFRKILIDQIFYELGVPVDRVKANAVVDAFVAAYPDLTDRLWLTRWVVVFMQSYGVDKGRLAPILSSIDADIQDATYFGLCSFYGPSWSSFEATYHVLKISEYLF